MRLLFLTHRLDTPSTRYRVLQFVPHLERAGHRVTVRPYTGGVLSIPFLLRAVRAHDATVVQKKLPPAWLTRAIRRRARRLVYDFDDSIFLAKTADGPRPSATRHARFRAMLEAADVVTAGNGYLSGVARAQGAKRVELIPTVIDPARYRSRTARGGRAIVGWVGAGGNLPYLERMLDVLEGLEATLRVVCDRFPERAPVPIERVLWSEAGEAEAVAGMDVGLAPMPDDEWTRGKCGTRLLQYGAAGVASVADAVGVHVDIVVDGQTGFLVRGRDEWRDRLRRLVSDPTLRSSMSVKAAQRVREHFSVDVALGRLRPLLE